MRSSITSAGVPVGPVSVPESVLQHRHRALPSLCARAAQSRWQHSTQRVQEVSGSAFQSKEWMKVECLNGFHSWGTFKNVSLSVSNPTPHRCSWCFCCVIITCYLSASHLSGSPFVRSTVSETHLMTSSHLWLKIISVCWRGWCPGVFREVRGVGRHLLLMYESQPRLMWLD